MDLDWSQRRAEWQPLAQQPTCTNLRIGSVEDAHKIFFAIRRGLLTMVSRRLNSDERAALHTGCVFAWEERSPSTEITDVGIERWTDSRRWGPSRVRDEFLFYFEKDSDALVAVLTISYTHGSDLQPVGGEQLIKQTYCAWVETEKGRRKWHLISYFTEATVGELGTVDDIPDVHQLEVPAGMFTSARMSKRKNTDTKVTAQAFPSPSPLPALAPRPVKCRPSTSHSEPLWLAW
ncbi:Gti1/Pac2 family-domain-containing protein [Mycena leptocephala]|nr:Gti1/Pac2 family-domain-containing protein [Mycena leptocephala]